MKYGDIFNRYKIGEFLGSGGSSEVYSAEHLVLKQLCAIKIMTGCTDPLAKKRFIREAQLAYGVDHPNIVKTFNAGCDEATGIPFIAMEYVHGKNLHQLAQKKPMNEEQLLEIIRTIGNALGYLHKMHVIHRDIKPSNIMRDQSGVYKLMDFGIAKSELPQEYEKTLNDGNVILGTPAYSAPEQCRESRSADIRSDIYSLGASIYHIASGHLPFSGKTPLETMVNVLNSAPEPLVKYRPDLSKAFISLVECMMSKDIQKRPADPQELLTLINKTSFLRSPLQYLIHKGLAFWYKSKPALRKYSIVLYLVPIIVLAAVLFPVFSGTRSAGSQTASAVPQFFDGYKQIAFFTPLQRSADYKLDPSSGKYENKNREFGIDFRTTQKDGTLKKQTAIYANSFIVSELTPQSFTVSLDYPADAKDMTLCAYGTKQELKLRKQRDKIELLLKNTSAAYIPLNNTSQKLQNVTFSYDGKEQYLHLFTGKDYLGSFRMKEKLSVGEKVFAFDTSNLMLATKIQNFQAFNGIKSPDGPKRILNE